MKLITQIERDPRVAKLYSEGDGWGGQTWWVELRPGFVTTDGPHGIHENTLTECRAMLRSVRPCACEDCNRVVPPNEKAHRSAPTAGVERKETNE